MQTGMVVKNVWVLKNPIKSRVFPLFAGTSGILIHQNKHTD